MVAFPLFAQFFDALWRFEPFPWQRMLAERLVEGKWPRALDLPTAAGKTACIDIAIYALAAQATKPVWERTAPRRIWFVVDRRIVVDEAFERAREIAEQLRSATDGPLKAVADRLRRVSGTERPLAVGRLRGGVLQDDGWARLPSQSAIITSTVDQLGSRLLFRGYGRSSQTASIFAGLAANDSLILLDEAHLSVPFMQTLGAVKRYRGERWAERPIRTPFAFCIMSATPPPDIPEAAVFPGADRNVALDHPELDRRLNASKPAELVAVKAARSPERDPFVEAAVERAVAFVKENRQRVAVIVNRVLSAEAIAQALREQAKGTCDVLLLTGRLRPFERDRLVNRWKPILRTSAQGSLERPLILVTTQCIEVGADFSFDALVTEAASLDALRQRFGRLNRLGKLESAPAVILARAEDVKAGAEDFIYGAALGECWRLLNEELAETKTAGKSERRVVDFGISTLDASLQALDAITQYLAPAQKAPLLLPAHLDILCQTSPRSKIEPELAFYLHGRDRGSPEVRIAWRADLDEKHPDRWTETVALCPPNSVETVSVPLYRLRRWLGGAAAGNDSGDVEGAREPEQQERKEHIRPVLLWQGRENSRVCTSASEIHPNDVVVLPDAYGITGLAQTAPDQALGKAQLDIWEPAHATSGKPVVLRLNRAVLAPWIACPPLQALLELAEDPAWDRAAVQSAISEVLSYRPSNEYAPVAPPAWWLELLEKVREGHYEQHPAGGLVLRAHKCESRRDTEQDLFADDDDLLSAAGQKVGLAIHCASVERAVERLARRCLPEDFRDTLKEAACWHDAGKLDERFQVMLRKGDELAAITEAPLAKSVNIPDSPYRRRTIRSESKLPKSFRHEMLSLQLAERHMPELNDGLDDLLLHLISSHHGYGRPFAPVSIDTEPVPIRGEHRGFKLDIGENERSKWCAPHALDSGVSERFWRMTRCYGWWGLAYLEAILRLGDWYGSGLMLDEVPERTAPASGSLPSRIEYNDRNPILLAGIDGTNPLGFLAAVGALVVLHQAGHREARLAWRRNGIAWRPRLTGLPKDEPTYLSRLLAEQLLGSEVSEAAAKKRKEAERAHSAKKKEIKNKLDEIKKLRLRGKARQQALEAEVGPLEKELKALRKTWLEAVRRAVPSPELALGKNIECTEPEYRAIEESLQEGSGWADRTSLDILAAFCTTGSFHESSQKRKAGKLAPTPFSFISGSGNQYFLDTAGKLMQRVSPERLRAALFSPWTYEDEGYSMRWDPVEARRHALMDRNPTASGNKPRTVWMANLLAYRALALFPSVPTGRGLATVGWEWVNKEQVFTWPLWSAPVGPDTLRSLLLLPELYQQPPDRSALRARGVEAILRSRRIKVGAGSNYKINFSPAREV